MIAILFLNSEPETMIITSLMERHGQFIPPMTVQLPPPNPPPVAQADHHQPKWTPEEDDYLKILVAQFGEDHWDEVAAQMPNRNQRQCSERYVTYLAPSMTNCPWTPEEDAHLAGEVQKVGQRWSKISMSFPGRSAVDIKNHWFFLEEQQRKPPEPEPAPVRSLHPMPPRESSCRRAEPARKKDVSNDGFGMYWMFRDHPEPRKYDPLTLYPNYGGKI
jgi:hypothetical protein